MEELQQCIEKAMQADDYSFSQGDSIKWTDEYGVGPNSLRDISAIVGVHMAEYDAESLAGCGAALDDTLQHALQNKKDRPAFFALNAIKTLVDSYGTRMKARMYPPVSREGYSDYNDMMDMLDKLVNDRELYIDDAVFFRRMESLCRKTSDALFDQHGNIMRLIFDNLHKRLERINADEPEPLAMQRSWSLKATNAVIASAADRHAGLMQEIENGDNIHQHIENIYVQNKDITPLETKQQQIRQQLFYCLWKRELVDVVHSVPFSKVRLNEKAKTLGLTPENLPEVPMW